MKYKVRNIVYYKGHGIFLAEFDNHYDLAMTFLRYQEYYESDNKKFKGKIFSIFDYMEWYSKKRDGVFTYPQDWSGFNIPDYVFASINSRRAEIPDYNKYDECMYDIVMKSRILLTSHHTKNIVEDWVELVDARFYIIGAVKDESDVMDHEIAHGLYYINQEYCHEMNTLIKQIPADESKILLEHFKELGYSKSVWNDEAQAYLSTDDYDWPISNKFKETFAKYTR